MAAYCVIDVGLLRGGGRGSECRAREKNEEKKTECCREIISFRHGRYTPMTPYYETMRSF
jgi:hypothetical protein